MTDFWGPKLWHLMHTVSFNANDHFSIAEKKMLFYFYKNIGNMIPCVFCRNNYKRHLIEYPIEHHLDNKTTLCNWVINKKLLDYKEAYENHKKIDVSKIIYIFRYLNNLAFLNRNINSLNNLLNFYRNLQYVYPTQKGRKLLIHFFTNYPILNQYANSNYFKTWYFNLERLIS